jgi:hypothetical protein
MMPVCAANMEKNGTTTSAAVQGRLRPHVEWRSENLGSIVKKGGNLALMATSRIPPGFLPRYTNRALHLEPCFALPGLCGETRNGIPANVEPPLEPHQVEAASAFKFLPFIALRTTKGRKRDSSARQTGCTTQVYHPTRLVCY